MSKWIIVSDNHTESGVLYQIYEMHPDADVYLHLGDSEFAYDDTELSLFNRVKAIVIFTQNLKMKRSQSVTTCMLLYSRPFISSQSNKTFIS